MNVFVVVRSIIHDNNIFGQIWSSTSHFMTVYLYLSYLRTIAADTGRQNIGIGYDTKKIQT